MKEKGVDLIALDEALNRLAEFDEQQARIVELRYFSGLSLEETAEALHISRATVARDWETARALAAPRTEQMKVFWNQNSSVNPKKWHEVKEIFYAALQHAPEEREKFLDESCRDDDLFTPRSRIAAFIIGISRKFYAKSGNQRSRGNNWHGKNENFAPTKI